MSTQPTAAIQARFFSVHNPPADPSEDERPPVAKIVYDSEEYLIPAGESVVLPEAVAHHGLKYYPWLELREVAPQFAPIAPAAPAPEFPCPFPTCEHVSHEMGEFQAHIAGHVTGQQQDDPAKGQAPAGDGKGQKGGPR